ncbi:MAG: hypothetical protein KKB21_01020 [Nanoarchaeota archaeon]|nr:hypothetical protein [Nanoarchaeota archaeon]MBU4086137.1 hypothetical protein [Nanoarchaeota archaeon]
MEDLDGHCAGECDCYPTPEIVLVSRRNVNRDFDRCMINISTGWGDYFSKFVLKARVRLAAAVVEDKFPKLYGFLARCGVLRPYSQ